MWKNKCQSILQKLQQNSFVRYIIMVLMILILFWGIMEADGANVTFVYNNF